MDGPDSYEICGSWSGTASLCLWSSVLDEGFPPDTPVPTPNSEFAQLRSFCFVRWVYCRGNTGWRKITAKSSYCGSVVTAAGMVRFRNSYPFLFCYRGSPDRDGMVSISMTIFNRFSSQYMLCLSIPKVSFSRLLFPPSCRLPCRTPPKPNYFHSL